MPPEGWASTNFGELLDRLQYGYTASASTTAVGPRFLRITDLQEEGVDWDAVPTCIVDSDQLDKYRLFDGDFVFARSGSTEKAWRVRTPPDAVFASYLIRGRPILGGVASWLEHFLKSAAYLEQIGAAGAGIGMQNVNAKKLAKVELPLPPLNEQKRIVAKIEELTTRSRRAKQALDAVPPLLDKLRQAILAAAFRGDLTADWRARNPNVEPASALLERMRAGRKARWAKSATQYRAPDRIVSAEEANLPELPQSWCWATAAEVVHEDTIVTYGIVQPGPQVDDGVPYVRGQDIVDGAVLRDQLKRMSPELAATKPHSVLQEGDVLLCIIRHLRVGVVPEGMDGANITQGAVRLRPSFMMSGSYLAEYLSAPFAQQWMLGKHFGLAMPRINVADARRVPIAVPPIAEQAAIVRMLGDILRPLRSLDSVISSSTQQLDGLDQSILAKAFRGDLVPQDPTDEPASALLARIQATREATPPPKPRRARKASAEASAPPKPTPAQLPLELTPHTLQPEVFAALWPRGPLDKDTAIRTLAEHLRTKNVIAFKRLRADSSLYAQLLAAIEASVKSGELDRPRRAHVRAIKLDATAYTPDDWRQVLLASVGHEPTHQEDAVRQAAEWARDNLGLEFSRLRADGHIATGLRSAINSAIRRGLIERDGPRRIRLAGS